MRSLRCFEDVVVPVDDTVAAFVPFFFDKPDEIFKFNYSAKSLLHVLQAISGSMTHRVTDASEECMITWGIHYFNNTVAFDQCEAIMVATTLGVWAYHVFFGKVLAKVTANWNAEAFGSFYGIPDSSGTPAGRKLYNRLTSNKPWANRFRNTDPEDVQWYCTAVGLHNASALKAMAQPSDANDIIHVQLLEIMFAAAEKYLTSNNLVTSWYDYCNSIGLDKLVFDFPALTTHWCGTLERHRAGTGWQTNLRLSIDGVHILPAARALWFPSHNLDDFIDLRQCRLLDRMPRLGDALRSVGAGGSVQSSYFGQRLDFATLRTKEMKYPLLKVQFEPGSPQTPEAEHYHEW